MPSKGDEAPLQKGMAEQEKQSSGGAEKAPRRRRACIVAIVVVVVILLVAVAVVVPLVAVRKSSDGGDVQPPPIGGAQAPQIGGAQPPRIRGARAIALACNVTRFPLTCNASLASDTASLTSSAKGLAAVAAAAATRAVATARTKATAYSVDPEILLNVTYGAFLDDCLDTLALAEEHVTTSQESLQGESPEFHTLKSSLSGALTFTGTCSDSLRAIPTLMGTELRQSVNDTFEVVSNALAITNSLAAHGENLETWTPMYFLANLRSPARRRMLDFTEEEEDEEEEEAPSPTWLGAHDRRILLGEVDPPPNTVVAQDGSGNHTTIQAAVDAAPLNSSARYVIRIKAGLYDEIVRVSSSQRNLMLLGDGVNQTVVTGNRSVMLMPDMTTFKSATVGVAGAGFLARGVTFRNTAGAEGHQAVALRVSADRCAFRDCAMESYQDTLWLHAFRQFYTSCTVAGTVDFVFGNAAAVLQSCALLARSNLPGKQNVFTAQGRTDPGQSTAIVIHNSTLVPSPDMNRTAQLTYLGRPWKQFSSVVILKSFISDIVDPSGWLPWNGDFALSTLFYGEYGNTGPGAGTEARVNWSTSITDAAVLKVVDVEAFLDAAAWLQSAGVPYSNYSL